MYINIIYSVILTISIEMYNESGGNQMEATQRIQLIRLIEKIEKNPEFSSKIGVKNTSEFTKENNRKIKRLH